jgi:hypothetical protein
MPKPTPAEVIRALKNNARAEAQERLDISLDIIDGLVKPLLEQGLVDLEDCDVRDLERLLRDS